MLSIDACRVTCELQHYYSEIQQAVTRAVCNLRLPILFNFESAVVQLNAGFESVLAW